VQGRTNTDPNTFRIHQKPTALFTDISLKPWLPVPGCPECIEDIPRSHFTHPMFHVYEQMDQMGLLKTCYICLTTLPKEHAFVNSALHSSSSTAGFCSWLSADYSKKQGKKRNSSSISTIKHSSGVVPSHVIHRIQNILIILNKNPPATNKNTLRML